ncbi:MAG: hypothetical protein IT306_21205 [Chloroflexi bacterium]|nr:hypothetical protein [Chloroflexota bacterium]
MSAQSVAQPATDRSAALGALAGLAVLKLVMLAALFTQTPPYPPPFFAPLFAASLALSALCAAQICARSPWLLVTAIPIMLESLLSYGPHKLYPGESPLFFAQTPAVYPVILVGTALILVLGSSSWRLHRATRSQAVHRRTDATTMTVPTSSLAAW